jgi:hypothetical protein
LRRRNPSTQLLSGLAADVLSHNELLKRFSCRTVAVGAETEYHLWVETNPPPQISSEHIGWLLAPDNIDRDELRDAPGDSVTTGLARKAASYLPPVFGIEVATVDLTPLGGSPPPMSRLLTTEQAGLSVDTTPTGSPLTDWLTWLDRTGRPYLLQTDLELTGDGRYWCWLRVAIFGLETQLLTDEHLAELLYDGWRGDLATVYDLEHLTSNIRLLRRAGWTVRKLPSPHENGSTYTLEWSPEVDIEYKKAERLANTVRSPQAEYQRCYRQSHPNVDDAVYEQFGVDPTIRLDRDDLSAVLGLIPGVSTPNQWDDHPGRESPHIEPVEIIRTAAGTSYEETADEDTLHGSTTDANKTSGDYGR